MKSISIKRSRKPDRERTVLLGLIEFHLKTGKPVASNTLRDHGFEELSSATIRNYFTKLEEEGYLKQQHSSGGRIPTALAYKFYAEEHLGSGTITEQEAQRLHALRQETKEMAAYLQQVVELLSDLTGCATFLCAPRFDHDCVLDIKLVPLDHHRNLCVLVTDFGLVQTEILYTEKKLSAFAVKRLEDYFRWRLTGQDKPDNLEEEEENLGQRFYNEAMVRYIVRYANFSKEDLYRSGFSCLLAYPEFDNATTLANGLALFESSNHMGELLRQCYTSEQLKYWIGDDLSLYVPPTTECAVVAIPYRINQMSVGAIGLLSPIRIPYQKLFGILHLCSEYVTESLTKSIYKFKIQFRQPEMSTLHLEKRKQFLLDRSHPILLEDKSK